MKRHGALGTCLGSSSRSSGLPEEWQQQGVYVVLITEAPRGKASCVMFQFQGGHGHLSRFISRNVSEHGITKSSSIQSGEADEFEEVGFAPSGLLLATVSSKECQKQGKTYVSFDVVSRGRQLLASGEGEIREKLRAKGNL